MQFLRFAVLLSLMLPISAFANLIGQQVTGSVTFGSLPTNYFDPTLGMVPATYLNFSQGTTVTVQPSAIEFGYQDVFNQIQLDFGSSSLQVKNISNSGISPFTITLAAVTPGAFSGIFLFNDNFAGTGIGYSMSNGVITLRYGGTNQAGTYIADFGIASVTTAPSLPLQPAPEPISYALTGSALLALAVCLQQQRKK